MTLLKYRPDWEEARERLTTWWHGGDIGRPVVQVSVPRAEPWEHIPPVPCPPAWKNHYSVVSLEYKVYLARKACVGREFLGESCPAYAAGDLAPNCLALFLGCRGVETPESVWCEPWMDEPEAVELAYNPDNAYWAFCRNAIRETAQHAEGRFLHAFPDLIEGLDTLCAVRGTENVLVDMIDRPEWVSECMRVLTDLYFRYYDMLYEMVRDDVGGSHWWIWAPGRLVKIQCDMSTMVSAEMFREHMVPIITEMSQRTGYSLYHLDGPGALHHVDALCEIPELDMIQWQPGAGAEGPWRRVWWPYLHRMLDAGKKIQIPITRTGYPEWHYDDVLEVLRELKREFGEQFKQFDLNTWPRTRAEAEQILRVVEF